MRNAAALAAMVLSCGSLTASRPLHNSRCPDTELHSGPRTEPGRTLGRGWAVPVRLCAFGKGFGLCNASGEPAGMTGFWELSPAEVANVDRALLVFLRGQRISRTDLDQYGRQHLGFFRGAHRYVFINAIPPDYRVTPEMSQGTVIAICDDNWGVEYDVATQQFTRLVVDSGPGP